MWCGGSFMIGEHRVSDFAAHFSILFVLSTTTTAASRSDRDDIRHDELSRALAAHGEPVAVPRPTLCRLLVRVRDPGTLL